MIYFRAATLTFIQRRRIPASNAPQHIRAASPIPTHLPPPPLRLRPPRPAPPGPTCGPRTPPPAPGAPTAKTDRQEPVISYATAYPAALLLMTILAKVLLSLL